VEIYENANANAGVITVGRWSFCLLAAALPRNSQKF